MVLAQPWYGTFSCSGILRSELFITSSVCPFGWRRSQDRHSVIAIDVLFGQRLPTEVVDELIHLPGRILDAMDAPILLFCSLDHIEPVPRTQSRSVVKLSVG